MNIDRLRVLVLTNLFPHSAHSVRAANVVTYELVKSLGAQDGVECGCVTVRSESEAPPTALEITGAEELASGGVEVLQPVSLPATSTARRARQRLFAGKIEDFYPQVSHAPLVWESVRSWRPDVILVPWSEWLTAVCADMPVTKFAYYGNPDAKSAAARLRFAVEHGEISLRDRLVSARDVQTLARLHLRQMMKYEMLGDVAANDATYYSQNGHPNAFYVRNLWIDRWNGAWRDAREKREQNGTIIGNVGKVGGTGNTLGLELLGKELLPILRNRIGSSTPYRIRVLGAGTIHPAVNGYLDSPEVEIAGFVDDIDEAIVQASILLCLNNASYFKVGQTRYLHAWSLGACVIAHEDAALSMPEIRHNENALLGKGISDIADLIKLALSDAPLRRRLGEAGYNTFREKFTADSVARTIVRRMRSALPAAVA